MTAENESERPEWWQRNEDIKRSMDLPEYTPPRFEDGTYVYEVTDPLEVEYDCMVRFVGVNPRYPDDWEVQVNGDPVFEIGRHRDDSGNTIYELTAEEFRIKFKSVVD